MVNVLCDAKNRGRQPRAIFECPFLDRPDVGGYVNAYKGPAFAKCLHPNLLQPTAENPGHQPLA